MMEENTLSLDRIKSFFFPNLEVTLNKQGFDIADIAMVILFAQRFFTYILVSLFGTVGSPMLIGILGVMYIVALAQRIKRKDNSALYIFGIVVLLIIALAFISILRFPELKFWIFGSEWNLLMQMLDLRGAVSALLLVLLVKKPQNILRNIGIASFINFVYLFYQAILYMASGNWDSYFTLSNRGLSYNMSFGYEMIFAAIAILTLALVKRSFVMLIVSALGFSFALFFGSRGILLTLFAYIFIAVVFVVGGTWKLNRHTLREKGKTVLLLTLVLVLGFVLTMGVPPLQRGVRSLSARITETSGNSTETEGTESVSSGGNDETLTQDPPIAGEDQTTTPQTEESEERTSRTVDAIIEGNLLDDNARFAMWRLALDSFMENPLTGKGLYGDRLAVGAEFNWGYSHNILFELMAQFGVWGILLLLFMIASVIRIWLRNDDIAVSLISLILIAMCAVLLVSDSYLINKYFWSLLALVFVYYNVYDVVHKRRKVMLISIVILAIGSTMAFTIRDYKQQTFKTIEFEEPTVLISVERVRTNTEVIHELIERYGFTGTSFANGHDIDMTNAATSALTADDVCAMSEKGWQIEDGEYVYQNPYIRSSNIQSENRSKTYMLFESLGLPEPRSYAPPYGRNNSTIQYRSMDQYSFIQTNSDGQGLRPFKRITYPRALDLDAMRLSWDNPSDGNTVLRYLDQAKDNGSLAVLYIDSALHSPDQVKIVLDYLTENGFVSTTYKELYEAAYDHSGRLGLKNYLENTFTANILSLVE